MNIGYACLTVGVPGTDLKSCIMKNAGDERLRELIGNNLDSLEKIIEYNISSGIRLFRISSDLIPFGSSPVNRLPWERLFSDRLSGIGKKIRDGGIRVSMHPGQYTVLNSPDPEVARRAAADLDYHCRLLESLGTGADCKIILHLGGAYGNKKTAIERFGKNFRLLDGRLAERL
ncbi:MAG: UV DNA damage repair endonuclease UvsE, partial [Clostridiales bacterium]|nr:UV DNA damage repair endonuclease UvsE [Clostridiales bacterium]